MDKTAREAARDEQEAGTLERQERKERGRNTHEGEGRVSLNKVKMNRELQGHVPSLNAEQNTTTLLTRENNHQHLKMDIEEREEGREAGRHRRYTFIR